MKAAQCSIGVHKAHTHYTNKIGGFSKKQNITGLSASFLNLEKLAVGTCFAIE